MKDLFEYCTDIASVGIIVDFTEDTETYIVGSPADIKASAYNGCPRKALKGLMRHSNKLGNFVKDINRFMKVKRELNEIMEVSDRLCNADALSNGNCNVVLEKLSEYYDVSEYANIVKNYIIYFLFGKFKLCQRDFHKKSGCPLRATTIVQRNILTCSKRTERKSSVRSLRQGSRYFRYTNSYMGSIEVLDSSLYRVQCQQAYQTFYP